MQSQKFELAVTAMLLVLFPQTAVFAAEDICPGGSSPRSNITWCADYENYTHPDCVNDPSSQKCIDQNGAAIVGVGTGGFEVVHAVDAAVGSGALRGIAPPGGTGRGYHNLPASLFPTTAFALRYYVRFTDGYLQVTNAAANHVPTPIINETGCAGAIALDFHVYGLNARRTSDCKGKEFPIPLNGTPWTPRNNRWYRIDIVARMNSIFGTGNFSSDGVFKVWIDGAPLYDYENIKLRDSLDGAFTDFYGARSYYGHGIPEWQGAIWYDNFAFSNDGTYIGPASNVNPPGTADSASPYHNYASYDGHIGRKMEDDCHIGTSTTGFVPLSSDYRDTGAYSLVPSPTHDGFTNNCNDKPDTSMRVLIDTSDSGGGYRYDLVGDPATYSINGYVYLPTGNDYANVTLAGFQRYGGPGGGRNWGISTGMSVSSGNWAIRERPGDSVDDQYILKESESAVTFDTWQWFEIIIEKAGYISLMIDGAWVIDRASTTVHTDIWDAMTPGGRGAVVGVTEYFGEQEFTVYYDDMHITSPSAWSCRGWSKESCPFETVVEGEGGSEGEGESTEGEGEGESEGDDMENVPGVVVGPYGGNFTRAEQEGNAPARCDNPEIGWNDVGLILPPDSDIDSFVVLFQPRVDDIWTSPYEMEIEARGRTVATRATNPGVSGRFRIVVGNAMTDWFEFGIIDEAECGDGEGGEGSPDPPHAADIDGDGVIGLSELLRVIQLFNSGGYHCAAPDEPTDDGYAPGTNVAQQVCIAHTSDYSPPDWNLSLSELLRSIQFFNNGDYHTCPAGEDGYCAGLVEAT